MAEWVENYSALILLSGASLKNALKGSKRKGRKCGRIAYFRGGSLTRAPHTNSDFLVELELGSFLNISRFFFLLYHFALIAREIAVFSNFCPFMDSLLQIFNFRSSWGGLIFIWTTPKNLKFFVDIKILHGHKKNTKHFLQIA